MWCSHVGTCTRGSRRQDSFSSLPVGLAPDRDLAVVSHAAALCGSVGVRELAKRLQSMDYYAAQLKWLVSYAVKSGTATARAEQPGGPGRREP